MQHYRRLAGDVDAEEEAEQRRLESGATARGAAARGAAARGAAARGAAARDAAACGAAACGTTCGTDNDSAGNNAPDGAGVAAGDAVEGGGIVLAPRAVSRTSSLAAQLSGNRWLVSAGEPVAHFLAANGPPAIVNYNWGKVNSWHCHASVTRQPVILDDPRYAHHNFADLLQLTSCGERALRICENKQPWVYKLELACTGKSHGLPKGITDPTNCARVCCGGLGWCKLSEEACSKRKPFQACSVRVLITANVLLVRQGKFQIELRGLHVPAGIERVPPPLCGLRIDAALQRQLVQLCKSSKQTPTTAIADLLPELKLAQRASSSEPAQAHMAVRP